MTYTAQLQRFLDDKILVETDLERYGRFQAEEYAAPHHCSRPFYHHKDTKGTTINLFSEVEETEPGYGWYTYEPKGKVTPLLRVFLNPRKYPSFSSCSITSILTTTKKKDILRLRKNSTGQAS